MIHKILNTIGLGCLGIDPFTAFYLLAMGLRKEKKIKIMLFFFSFAGFSIFIGALLAIVFGVVATEFLQSLIPDDNSPFWVVLQFALSVIILLWVCKKLFVKAKNTETSKEQETVSGNNLKYIVTGIVFAISCFTDPTYYAVILIGGETGNILTAILLLTIWFMVSQFMAVIVYIAIELNALGKLISFIDRLKTRNEKSIKIAKYIIYLLLACIALFMLADTGFYLFNGRYLF